MAPSNILTPPTGNRPGIRRFSSMTATERDIKGVPVEAMLSLISSSPETPGSLITPVDVPTTDSFAFSFDIDGVLVRGGRPIPEVIEAMKVLNRENEYGLKVPCIFLTNGGGKTEVERCIDISRQLNIEVSLLSAEKGRSIDKVAKGYGFRDIITPSNIIKDNKATTPFCKLTIEEKANFRKRDYGNTKIEAIFVFTDSRDWAGDIQIMLDLAMSKGGYIGTLSKTFNDGPLIYFSHNNIIWSAAHNNGERMNIVLIDLLKQSTSSATLLKVISEGTQPAYTPKITIDTVTDAVKYGMKREFSKICHNRSDQWR
ncbi:hypothetical protein V8E51_015915 [Hyaloscypha variabilis]